LYKKIVFSVLLSVVAAAHSDNSDDCLVKKLKNSASTTTVGELKSACTDTAIDSGEVTDHAGRVISTSKARLLREQETQWSPYVLTAYKQNYILLYTHADGQNPIYGISGDSQFAEKDEAKFQLSVKVPLAESGLLLKGDSLHLGFTMKSFWQIYNPSRSAPVRETDYSPEIFYTVPLNYKPNDANTAFRLGLQHESNGRAELFSRSWNRFYTEIFYARNNYLISLRPWYRIPEVNKKSSVVSSDDDNPDIEKYMGNFELNGVVTHSDMEFSALFRNNLRSENYGAIEMGVSFPLWRRIRGYAQYFNGYGDSLIDYNHRMERFGIGFLITDLM